MTTTTPPIVSLPPWMIMITSALPRASLLAECRGWVWTVARRRRMKVSVLQLRSNSPSHLASPHQPPPQAGTPPLPPRQLLRPQLRRQRRVMELPRGAQRPERQSLATSRVCGRDSPLPTQEQLEIRSVEPPPRQTMRIWKTRRRAKIWLPPNWTKKRLSCQRPTCRARPQRKRGPRKPLPRPRRQKRKVQQLQRRRRLLPQLPTRTSRVSQTQCLSLPPIATIALI
mmetsp:Transcript_9722/g.27246  ORF Transcript_9722/g.27246 Transcript_9722/m.27246 type:complete len:227 (-) Transcript_9722:3138-3818(-)